jgi:putative tryptophan/tyrosine transport system substrate-binding protein
MQRRKFITLLGSAAVTWPLAALAQQPGIPVIGVLNGGSAEGISHLVEAFRQGLKETGFTEGQNLAVQYRWANGQYDRLPELAADLVRRQVAVLAVSTPVAALAAKQATTSIPIVFALGSDPVKDKLVTSLNRPGGNITGATFFSNLLASKRFELLKELVPNAKVVAMLLNPKNTNAEFEISEAQKAASALGLQIILLKATTEGDIENTFVNLPQQHVDALLIAGDALFLNQRKQIAELAGRNGVPTSFPNRDQAVAGGLMSYGASIADTWRQVGNYVGRILKGENPADLPVQQPTKFELVVNLTTARALGLKIPQTLLVTADEVIE